MSSTRKKRKKQLPSVPKKRVHLPIAAANDVLAELGGNPSVNHSANDDAVWPYDPSIPDDEFDITDLLAQRPRTRGDCKGGPRPCPWAGCPHSLYGQMAMRDGKPIYQINQPAKELWERNDTCVLDVADRHRGDVTLEDIGRMLDLTRERIRQIENKIYSKIRNANVNRLKDGPLTSWIKD